MIESGKKVDTNSNKAVFKGRNRILLTSHTYLLEQDAVLMRRGFRLGVMVANNTLVLQRIQDACIQILASLGSEILMKLKKSSLAQVG